VHASTARRNLPAFRLRTATRMRVLLLLCAALCAASEPLMSADDPCARAEARQFDFWLGDWDVVAPPGAPNAGALLGRNRIERVANGCGLAEHWRGASGFDGTSLNAWDPAQRVWRQFWVGRDGVVLRLEGGLDGGDMLLQGTLPGADGRPQRQRIRWSPRAGGGLTQHWEISDDDGATWQTSFLGVYRRRDAAG
jgi:hypothetical protein